MDGSGPQPPRRPSRTEVEALCILLVLRGSACTFAELTERLGLAAEHVTAVESITPALVSSGCVEVHDGIVSATRGGLDWLAAKERELLRQLP